MNSLLRASLKSGIPFRQSLVTIKQSRYYSSEHASSGGRSRIRGLVIATAVGLASVGGAGFAYCVYDPTVIDMLESATGVKLDFLHSGRRAAQPYLPFLQGGARPGLTAQPPALPSPSRSSPSAELAKQQNRQEKLEKTRENIEAQHSKSKADKSKQQQQQQQQAAEDLLVQLTTLQKSAESAVNSAVTKSIALETKAKQHGQQLKRAMETKLPADFKSAEELETEKLAAAELAVQLRGNAEQQLQQLRQKLEKDEASESPAGKEAIECLKSLQFELSSVTAAAEKAMSETRILKEYHEESEKRKRESLPKEVESLLPLNKRSPDADLSREDLQLLIAHAHSKILELQRELEDLKDKERHLVQDVIDKSSQDGQVLADAAVEREIQHQRLLWIEEKEKLERSLREEFESQLHRELTRQAAAHTSHVTELTAVLQERLHRQHQADTRARLLKEQEEFESALASWTARVRGVEAAVEGRATQLIRAQRAQQMWLGAHSWLLSVIDGRPGRQSFLSALTAAQLLGEGDTLTCLTGHLPDVDSVAGENALATRFTRVASACKRVAMVPITGGSLWLHCVSRLQAALMSAKGCKPLTPDSIVNEQGDNSVNNFTLLATAEAAVQRGDLSTAVRAASRLTGMPRLLADDWLLSARQHLEFRQAAAAACAVAAAVGVDAATQHRLPAADA